MPETVALENIERACQQWWARLSLGAQVPVAVAYSGGLDSTVLLHALAQLRTQAGFVLHAWHIHHGLSPNADAWQSHCAAQATAWGIPFATQSLKLQAHGVRRNIEAWARAGRYTALAALAAQHQLTHLVTAHHQDDQAETFLLHALRGSGVLGLAAMPPARPILTGAGETLSLHRPFLNVSKAELLTYAQYYGLRWVEDESNQSDAFLRNALRQQVLPLLSQLQPAAAQTLARSAALAAEAESVLQEVAAQDWQQAQGTADHLSLTALRALSLPRQRNLLRYTLRQWACLPLSEARLHNFLEQCQTATPDSQAQCQVEALDGVPTTLRLWRGQIWRVREGAVSANPLSAKLVWQGQAVWPLPDWGGVLHFVPSQADGIPVRLLQGKTLQAQARQGGERLRLHPHAPSRSLKNLYQEQGLPPWQRQEPVLMCDAQLMFIPSLGVDAAFGAAPREAGEACVTLVWDPIP